MPFSICTYDLCLSINFSFNHSLIISFFLSFIILFIHSFFSFIRSFFFLSFPYLHIYSQTTTTTTTTTTIIIIIIIIILLLYINCALMYTFHAYLDLIIIIHSKNYMYIIYTYALHRSTLYTLDTTVEYNRPQKDNNLFYFILF
ncbi:hypothetical protein J3Q64DRAFT_1260959 [Phycomyces blakesleeanus]|uniref:Uncharacterized protein n=1 Tax=Phycomyces blakesleeanus TaxID=4837 RepID=A0ABR3AQB8_PHYBL